MNIYDTIGGLDRTAVISELIALTMTTATPETAAAMITSRLAENRPVSVEEVTAMTRAIEQFEVSDPDAADWGSLLDQLLDAALASMA